MFVRSRIDFRRIGFHGTRETEVPQMLKTGIHPKATSGLVYTSLKRFEPFPHSRLFFETEQFREALTNLLSAALHHGDNKLTRKRADKGRNVPLQASIVLFDRSKAVKEIPSNSGFSAHSEEWKAEHIPASAIIGTVTITSRDLKGILKEFNREHIALLDGMGLGEKFANHVRKYRFADVSRKIKELLYKRAKETIQNYRPNKN